MALGKLLNYLVMTIIAGQGENPLHSFRRREWDRQAYAEPGSSLVLIGNATHQHKSTAKADITKQMVAFIGQ